MRWPRRLPFSLLIACCWPAAAGAQSAVGQVQLDQYQPSPFSDRVLRLDGATVLPWGHYRLGIDLDYALRPLVLTESSAGISQVGSAGGPAHNIVENAVGGSLLASAGLGHRLELGVAVPLTLLQSGDSAAGAVRPAAAGIGNIRIGLKARLLDRGRTALGGAILAAVPAGAGSLAHESGLGGEARLFAGYRRGALTLGGRAGFRLRASQTFYDVALGNELTGAVGATWQLGGRTAVLAEIAGATAARQPFATARQSPLEGLLGVRRRVGKTWFTLAGGPGLVNGYGSPLFRLVAGVTWANLPPDSDGDGVPDDVDQCPSQPEDRDGFQDSDGCPDLDNDGDGIPDATDRCPDAPEDRDGFQDGDGCPDPDNDGDGIPDTLDKCPNQPETVNDFEDDDGCPDRSPPAADKDGDGIPDDVDECPEEAEDKDGFEDADGCPDLDNDKDGIPDATDKCPLEPETINGIDDDDGCPDKGQAQVRLGKNEIETLQPIYFDTDRSRVRHAFHNILGQIASLLKAHPEIGRCGIEGHTDDTGPAEWNQKLSVLRAISVIEFLSDKGVDPKRLVPIGHAERLPWASNDTPEGRAKNRRVVFHIEGVNPEEQKKQEQRQERRQRIRRRRDLEQQQEQPKAAPPDAAGHPAGSPRVAPGPVNKATGAAKGAPVVVPPERPVPDASTKAAAAGTVAARPSTPPIARTAAGAGGRGGSTASIGASPKTPAPLTSGAAPRTTLAPAAPRVTGGPPPLPPHAVAPPTTPPPKPAPPTAERPPDEKDVTPGSSSSRPRSPGRRPVAAKRTQPDGGPPATLEDLLKLPPR